MKRRAHATWGFTILALAGVAVAVPSTIGFAPGDGRIEVTPLHSRMVVTDLDADPEPELVTAGGTSTALVIHQGLGAGLFDSGTTILVPDGVEGLRAFDVDDDGDVDILATHAGTSTDDGGETVYADAITLLRNDGTGTFTEESLTGSWPFTFDVLALDWNADGNTDLLAWANGRGYVLLGETDGSGDFQDAQPLAIATPTPGGGALFEADLDGDGDLDVFCGGAQVVFVQQPDGTYSVRTDADAPASMRARPADLDGDGAADLVISKQSFDFETGSTVETTIHWNDGSGEFTSSTQLEVTEPVNQFLAVDVDEDGDLDVITHDSFGSAVYENLGSRSFSDPVVLFDPEVDLTYTADADFLDLDANGTPEVVAINPRSGEVVLYERSSAAAPSVTSITPAGIVAGENRSFTITGSNFTQDLRLDFGLGLDVGEPTIVSSEELTVTISASAPLPVNTPTGPRTAAVLGVDGKRAEFQFSVEAGPEPSILEVVPSTVFAGVSTVLTFGGANFDALATLDLGDDVVIGDVTLVDADTLRAEVTFGASAETGIRTVTLTNGTGREAELTDSLLVEAPLALDLGLRKAVAKDRRRAGRDMIVFKGTLARNEFADDEPLDPITSGATLRFGDDDTPFELTIAPGDDRWRVRRGKFVWTNKGQAGSRIKVKLDTRRGRFVVKRTRFDLADPLPTTLLMDLAVGDERGLVRRAVVQKRRKLRLKK